MIRPDNPELAHLPPAHRAALEQLLGSVTADPVELLQRQVHELSCRLEDLAALVANWIHSDPGGHGQPPPGAGPLIRQYAACPHGRILHTPCPDCERNHR